MNLLKTLINLPLLAGMADFIKPVEVKVEAPEKPRTVTETLAIIKAEKEKAPEILKKNAKLTHVQQEDLIRLIAQGLTMTQVMDVFEESTGIKLSIGTINDYRFTKKWRPFLDAERDKFLNRIDLLDGSHKAVRVRRMEHVFEKGLKKGDLKVAISANEQIRKEFVQDGDTTVLLNSPIYAQFNTLTNEELLKRQKDATEKLREAH